MFCENQEWGINRKGYFYVFTTNGSAAFVAVNTSDGVVACRHWAIVGLAFDDIYLVEIIRLRFFMYLRLMPDASKPYLNLRITVNLCLVSSYMHEL